MCHSATSTGGAVMLAFIFGQPPILYIRIELGNFYAVRKTACGTGGRYPKELCGRTALYGCTYRLVSTCASCKVLKSSPFSNSSRIFELKRSQKPFSQGLPGPIEAVETLRFRMKLPPMAQSVFNKVAAPYMVLIFSSQADTATVIEPESATF